MQGRHHTVNDRVYLHPLEPMSEQGQVISVFRSGLELIQSSSPPMGMTWDTRDTGSHIIRKPGLKMAER